MADETVPAGCVHKYPTGYRCTKDAEHRGYCGRHEKLHLPPCDGIAVTTMLPCSRSAMAGGYPSCHHHLRGQEKARYERELAELRAVAANKKRAEDARYSAARNEIIASSIPDDFEFMLGGLGFGVSEWANEQADIACRICGDSDEFIDDAPAMLRWAEKHL